MKKHIIIIDPLDAGIELAPTFKACGIPAIAVTLKSPHWIGFGMKIQHDDFVKIIPNQANLVEILRHYNPIAIIPGTEEAIPLAEQLTLALTPQYANHPATSRHRSHKAFMQTALEESHVPALKTLNAFTEKEVERWIHVNHFTDVPLILKPPMSAGSDKVFHIPARGNWKPAFQRILLEPTHTTGRVSQSVVVQEQAFGTEFAVGTVTANGKHYLAHLIKYNKTTLHDRKTVFDYVEFVPYDEYQHGELFNYTQKVLDVLGIRWGAAHTEIMLTDQGPRLIETSARMCGGPVVRFARAATGSSQADKLLEIYTNGDVLTKQYLLKKPVIPVFLKSPTQGKLKNIEIFNEINALSTLLNKYIWFNNGDNVPQTVDYLTSIGIIGLMGDREAMLKDYKTIRRIEANLIIESYL